MTTIKTILYPRPAYTQIIIDWSDGNWNELVADRRSREAVLYALRGSVQRLVLPPRYARMRNEILSPGGGGPTGERAGQEPQRALLGVLIGNLRYHGYIYRIGNGWALSPVTPRQTHLIRLLAEGNSLKRVASLFGVEYSSTRRICQGALETTGAGTSAGLVGMALYEGWIPGRSESENLARNLGDGLGPGYFTR